MRLKGDTGENLIGLLERRLDTIVYRAKIVPTVFAAGQFINHGHVKVNGRKTNIGSAMLKIGDIVEVREKSRDIPMVIQALDSAEREIPEYVKFNREKLHISIKRIPGLSDVPYPVQMEPNLVIEFYSR